MRFTAATVALFAGLAAALPNGADTTVYQTEEVTITSCGPEVTNCPASSTGVPATSVPAVTTTPAGAAPVPTSSAPVVSSAPAPPVVSSVPAPAPPAVTPSVSLITHTSCVPTTWVQTKTIQPPAPSTPAGGGVPHAPSSSVAPSPVASASPSSSPVYNGAGAVSGSMTFAGLAAAAAFFLA